MAEKKTITNEDLLQFAKIINKQFADLATDLRKEIADMKQSQVPIKQPKELPKDEDIKESGLVVVKKNGQIIKFQFI